jgi:hypothetical protein
VVVHDPYLRSAPATVRGLGPAAGDADKPTVSEPAAGIVICAAHREYREMSRADLESILATPEKPRVVFDCSGQVVPIELPNTRWMTL